MLGVLLSRLQTVSKTRLQVLLVIPSVESLPATSKMIDHHFGVLRRDLGYFCCQAKRLLILIAHP